MVVMVNDTINHREQSFSGGMQTQNYENNSHTFHHFYGTNIASQWSLDKGLWHSQESVRFPAFTNLHKFRHVVNWIEVLTINIWRLCLRNPNHITCNPASATFPLRSFRPPFPHKLGSQNSYIENFHVDSPVQRRSAGCRGELDVAATDPTVLPSVSSSQKQQPSRPPNAKGNNPPRQPSEMSIKFKQKEQ